GYLAGGSSFEDALVHPADWYREHNVNLALNTRVTAIDAAAHQVQLANDATIGYDKLALATGSVPRQLPVPGGDADGVLYLRTREDADAIRAHLGGGKKLAIIGAGWIGLEVAAAARAAGTEVTIIEMAELPLLAVLGAKLAQVFADLHTGNGVDLRLGTRLEAITTEDGHASGVRLGGGDTVQADAVIVGVGVAPDTALAESAGLALDNGVLVDGSLRTSDPDIYAVGDIANHDHPVLGHRVRVEHWATALHQPAAAMLGNNQAQYTELPYFYSDQYDLAMEYVGHARKDAYQRLVVRGNLDKREFVAFWLTGENRIKAAMSVNVWDVVDQFKSFILSRRPVNPDRLADPSVAYSAL
ncbi:MAG: NAD(P)/FAD-dependent oxidoreductase, partial [Trebonia sp.]